MRDIHNCSSLKPTHTSIHIPLRSLWKVFIRNTPKSQITMVPIDKKLCSVLHLLQFHPRGKLYRRQIVVQFLRCTRVGRKHLLGVLFGRCKLQQLDFPRECLPLFDRWQRIRRLGGARSERIREQIWGKKRIICPVGVENTNQGTIHESYAARKYKSWDDFCWRKDCSHPAALKSSHPPSSDDAK